MIGVMRPSSPVLQKTSLQVVFSQLGETSAFVKNSCLFHFLC